MRRALAATLLVAALGATGCVPVYEESEIEGTDLSTRYPDALQEARQGLSRAVAAVLVLFTACLAGDLALRGRGRDSNGGALVTAGAAVGLLTAATLVVAAGGSYPRGLAYRVAANAPIWLALAMIPAGIAWLVRGFRYGPGDRGEAVWGFFLVLVGVVLVPVLYVSQLRLWLCGGTC